MADNPASLRLRTALLVQLVGAILVFGLGNGTIMDRSIAVKVAAPLAP
jgi:hypothetical protein